MSLVFAAISPHPPLLIPSIGKENIKEVEKTKKSLLKLEEAMYLARPDIIVLISPHGSYFSDAFTINVSPNFHTDLTQFGDLETKIEFKGEMNLSSRLRECGKDENIPITMISEPKLDHGSSVPLYYLAQHLIGTSILPIGFCSLDWKTHVEFGYLIKDAISQINKRVAVIASGDLSHALKTEAPAGYNAAGEEFDTAIRELLQSNNTVGMLNLNKKFVEDAAECGFRSILILMGILRNINSRYQEYSYEGPYGVGYLVSNFII
ncbi:MAG: AmmeMemoRadiSam system protein B [bacterium]